MVNIDIVGLSILEDEGDEDELRAVVMETLRRGDMSPEAQRWLAACFEPNRGRRKRNPDEKPQTKFRLEFQRRNGMKKSNDISLSSRTRREAFEEACDRFGGPERAIEELDVRGEYGGFTWSKTTAKDCFEAIMASRERE